MDFVVKLCCAGVRTNANTCDMSAVLPENVEEEVKQQAEISMGSEISEEDILNITHLCDQVRSCAYCIQCIQLCIFGGPALVSASEVTT